MYLYVYTIMYIYISLYTYTHTHIIDNSCFSTKSWLRVVLSTSCLRFGSDWEVAARSAAQRCAGQNLWQVRGFPAELVLQSWRPVLWYSSGEVTFLQGPTVLRWEMAEMAEMADWIHRPPGMPTELGILGTSSSNSWCTPSLSWKWQRRPSGLR